MRSPSALMRSLKEYLIEILIEAPCHRIAERNGRKRREFHHQLGAAASAKWNGRLPGARAETGDAFDLFSGADISRQQQSPFFTKLPPELRRLIYAYAIGGEELQLELQEDGDTDAPFSMRCAEAQRVLAFTRSCKLAYIEASQCAYSDNTFRIPNITAFFCLQRLLPARWFHAIRHIRLRWAYIQTGEMWKFLYGYPPYNASCWSLIWSEISKMRALEHVRVDMVPGSTYIYADYEHALFTPLETAQGSKEFEVYASWPEHKDLHRQGKTWPFKITRGVEWYFPNQEQAPA